MSELTEFRLERTGDLPLTFGGEELATADSYRYDGPGNNRWHELRLYRTKSGRFVLAVTYRTRWQGEDDHHFVTHADSAAAVRDELKLYPVPLPGTGYPPTEHFAARQERMVADLRRRFDQAVSELFRGTGGDGFVERID